MSPSEERLGFSVQILVYIAIIFIDIPIFRFRPEDLHRIRVEHMERQLANLTGLVQKALTQNVAPVQQGVNINQNYLNVTAPYRGKLTFCTCY